MDIPLTAERPSSPEPILKEIEGIIAVGNETEKAEKWTLFRDGRLRELEAKSVPGEVSFMTGTMEEFLHPDSKVVVNFLVSRLKLNDPEAYDELFKAFQTYMGIESWKSGGMGKIAPQAVYWAVGNYFGNIVDDSSTEAKRVGFYEDHWSVTTDDINLKEIKGKEVALCGEKAGLAHNFFKFLGYDSTLVTSSRCVLGEGGRGHHIYLLVQTAEGKTIYDPANPSLIFNEDGVVIGSQMAGYGLGKEASQKLLSGGQIEVMQRDYVWNGNAMRDGGENKLIYAGPNVNLT